jgi:aspartate-semialdehyde dehydrogenase
MKRIRVGILGATGLVGRAACAAITANPRFELGTLVGSANSDNTPFQRIWEKKEQELVQHYGADFWQPMPFPPRLRDYIVEDFQTMVQRGNNDVILSALPLRAGDMEDELLRNGQVVFSASPYRRFDDDVKLIVCEANGHLLEPKDVFVKSPNCCSNGVCVSIAPIHAAFGIRELTVTTFQSISGRGDLKYAKHLVHGNVYPIGRTEEKTEKFITAEISKVYRGIGEPFKVSVSSQRVHTQKNHFLDLRMKCSRRPKDRQEIVDVLRNFHPLVKLHEGSFITHNTGAGTSSNPIIVTEEVGTPRPIMPDGQSELGMKVMVGQIDVDDIYDVRMSVMVDNIDRGAFGGLLQSAEVVFRYLRTGAAEGKEVPPTSVNEGSNAADYERYFACADASST